MASFRKLEHGLRPNEMVRLPTEITLDEPQNSSLDIGQSRNMGSPQSSGLFPNERGNNLEPDTGQHFWVLR